MFFRRKPLTLESLDQRLSVVELALEIRRQPNALTRSSPLETALANLRRAIDGEKPINNN